MNEAQIFVVRDSNTNSTKFALDYKTLNVREILLVGSFDLSLNYAIRTPLIPTLDVSYLENFVLFDLLTGMRSHMGLVEFTLFGLWVIGIMRY